MGKKNLILFTSSFPYGKGENFIDVELKFLAPNFDNIFIFPYHYGGNDQIRYSFPDHIRVYKPFRDENHTFAKLLFRGIFNFRPLFIYLQDIFIKPSLLIKHTQFSLWLRSLLNCRMILQDKRLNEIREKYNGNLIYYFYWGNRPSGIITGLIKQNDPVIIRFHGSDLYREMKINDGYIPFQKIAVTKASQVICISEHGAQYLRQSYPQINKEIKVFRLGTIDHGPSVGRAENILKVISCSVIDENKRVLLIPRILNNLDFQVHWTHIGEGPLKHQLENELLSCDKNKLQTFLAGRLLNEQVHEVFKNQYFDLFINLSKSEGVPFSIMEALSYSIPVVATAVGGVPEIVDDSCGKVVHKDADNESIIRFISYFNCLSLDKKSEFRENSRRRWEDLCNAEKNYKEFMNFLDNL